MRANVEQAIYSYCNEVINNEWQMDAKTRIINKPNAIRNLRGRLLTTSVENKKEQNVLAVMDAQLNALDDLRRDRLNHGHSQVPSMVWFILDAGSIMVVAFFFFLSVPSLKLKRIYLTFLVSSMAMCMFLVYTLDHPFSCKSGISSGLYQNLQHQIKNMSTTG